MYGRCNTADYGSAHGRAAMHRREMGHYRRPKYNVPVNIAERDDAYEVSIYATGFPKEHIKLSVSDEVLYVTGTRELSGDAPQFIKQEFPVKHFERVIALNGQVDATRITARQEGEVLYITLPKTEAAQKPDQEIKVD